MCWSVYMILCDDGSLYTGISKDVAARFARHAAGRGAKYFRGRQPEKVVYQETNLDQTTALQREYAIKQLSRQDKWRLVQSQKINSAKNSKKKKLS